MSGYLLTLLLLIDPKAGKVDVSGGIAAETRVGRAPVSVVSDPETSFLMIVTPNADLRVRHRRRGEFTIGYAPRVQWRLPNRLSINRPILLHQLYSLYGVPLTRRWRMQITTGASVGELDYTGFSIGFGDTQAGLPDVDVAQFVIGTAAIRFEGEVDRRQALFIEPSVATRAPILDTRRTLDDFEVPLRTQTIGTLTVGHRYAATRLDTVSTTLAPGVVDYDQQTTYATGSGRVDWARRLTLRLQTEFGGGLFVAQPIRNSETASDKFQAFPIGSGTIVGRLRSRSSHWVEGRLSLGAGAFFDRLEERVEPRGNVAARINTVVPPRWVIGALVAAYTPLTSEPELRAGIERDDETTIRGETPITYTINDSTRFEFGTVFSVRSNHLAASSFSFTRLETWLYVAIRFSGSTARGGEEIGDRASQPIGVGSGGVRPGTGGV